jgi:hypothetical protein
MTVFGWTSLTDRTEDSGEVLRSLKATGHCNIDYAALGASQHLFSLLLASSGELLWTGSVEGDVRSLAHAGTSLRF